MENSKAILKVPGTMEIRPAEMPVLRDEDVLIKVEYVGIADLMFTGLNQDLLFRLKIRIRK